MISYGLFLSILIGGTILFALTKLKKIRFKEERRVVELLLFLNLKLLFTSTFLQEPSFWAVIGILIGFDLKKIRRVHK